jgi:hypothetical protein
VNPKTVPTHRKSPFTLIFLFFFSAFSFLGKILIRGRVIKEYDFTEFAKESYHSFSKILPSEKVFSF